MSQTLKPPNKLFVLSHDDVEMEELYGEYTAFATRSKAMEHGRGLLIETFRVHEYRLVRAARPRRYRNAEEYGLLG